jgi:hypothetical protein
VLLADHGGNFFGVKRIVAESGREGSRERRSSTRLRLPSATVAVSWSVAFLAAASSSRVSSFDLGGYSALMAVFFGWSRASS